MPVTRSSNQIKATLLEMLGPERREKLAADRAELKRLHGLADVWLANELLRLARAARQAAPDRLGAPNYSGYDNGLVWDVIPDVACRLSPILRSHLSANEARDYDLISREGSAYRDWAGSYIRHSSLSNWSYRAEYQGQHNIALRLLGNIVVNGNPVAMALDRIYPPEHSDDCLAKEMRSISRTRGHAVILSRWSPEFNLCPHLLSEPEFNPTPHN